MCFEHRREELSVAKKAREKEEVENLVVGLDSEEGEGEWICTISCRCGEIVMDAGDRARRCAVCSRVVARRLEGQSGQVGQPGQQGQ